MQYKDEVDAELKACSRLAKLTPSSRRLQEKSLEAKERKRVKREELAKKKQDDENFWLAVTWWPILLVGGMAWGAFMLLVVYR